MMNLREDFVDGFNLDTCSV